MKRDTSRRCVLQGLGVGVASAVMMPRNWAWAAPWPERPITAVAGFAAGGGIDGTARAITAQMELALNATINVTNRPGAAASVASNYVLRQPADGYHWLFTATYNKTHRPQKLAENPPFKDWQFFNVDTSIMSWSVPADSPIMDFDDFLERAKASPGAVTVANSGVGDIWHLGSILLQQTAGIKLRDVPYQGGAPATLAALQNEVQVVGSGIHEHVEHIRAGTLRNLAVFTAEPLEVSGTGTFKPVTEFLSGLASSSPYGGGATMALRRDTEEDKLRLVGEALRQASETPEFRESMERRVRFVRIVMGPEADRTAAYEEVVTANLLAELGQADALPQELGLPTIEGFEEWWQQNAPEPAM